LNKERGVSQEQEHSACDRRDRFAVWIWLAGFAIMALMIAHDSMQAIIGR
jgi:hypothetical protein